MASTNPFTRANLGSRQGRRAASGRQKQGLRSPGTVRGRQPIKAANNNTYQDADSFSSWPTIAELKPVLLFLILPGMVALAVILGGGLPKPVLYTSGFFIAVIVAFSALKTVEITVACIILYLPFSKLYVIPVLPGLNGTNMLIMLGFVTAALRSSREKEKFIELPPGALYVLAFGFYTALSAITIFLIPGGGSVLFDQILSYKSWLDQFIIYLILAACIRDRAGAKRALVYIMIGSMCVVLHTVPEMFEKMGRSSIEKSRLLGPQVQANNFGGFLGYTLLPILAFFLVFIKDIRAWLLTPYFLLSAKILITTFSRGAYLGFAAGGLLAGYYRGKTFLVSIAAIGLLCLVIFPQIIPDSITARMGDLVGKGENAETWAPKEETLDKSSSTRIDMWMGALKMMEESPIFGKGFKSFEYLKDQYVDGIHKERDPHSMYLYIGSQMGTPALLLFVFLLYHMFSLGRTHSKNKNDQFVRAAGIGGAAVAVCYAIVCIFGSRAVALNFTIYFWAYLLILQVMRIPVDDDNMKVVDAKGRRKRGGGRGAHALAQRLAAEPLALAANEAPLLETDRKTRQTAPRRLPKRGAAAYLAKEAEKEKQNVLKHAVQAPAHSTSQSLAIQSDSAVDSSGTSDRSGITDGIDTVGRAEGTIADNSNYETRGARRARLAAEASNHTGRRKRLKKR